MNEGLGGIERLFWCRYGREVWVNWWHRLVTSPMVQQCVWYFILMDSRCLLGSTVVISDSMTSTLVGYILLLVYYLNIKLFDRLDFSCRWSYCRNLCCVWLPGKVSTIFIWCWQWNDVYSCLLLKPVVKKCRHIVCLPAHFVSKSSFTSALAAAASHCKSGDGGWFFWRIWLSIKWPNN